MGNMNSEAFHVNMRYVSALEDSPPYDSAGSFSASYGIDPLWSVYQSPQNVSAKEAEFEAANKARNEYYSRSKK